MREELKKGKEYCVGQFKKRASDYDSWLKQTQSQLKQVSAQANESERHDLHCRIQDRWGGGARNRLPSNSRSLSLLSYIWYLGVDRAGGTVYTRPQFVKPNGQMA